MNTEESLYNLNINLNGWQGTFDYYGLFLRMAERVKEYDSIRGANHVLANGRIMKGFVQNLHTFEGDINLEEGGNVHIHYGSNSNSNHMAYILNKHSSFYLDQIACSEPIFTFSYLSGKLKGRKIEEKIKVLSEEIKDHTNYDIEKFLKDSISKRKETKLKLVEQKYRNLVSNK